MNRACALALLKCPISLSADQARLVAVQRWRRAVKEFHGTLGGEPGLAGSTNHDRFEAAARFSLLRRAVLALT